jgi:YgiT-type zinc finger domain-containing protein
MKCPSCGFSRMKKTSKNKLLTRGNTSILLTDMKGHICPRCHDTVLDEHSYKRYVEAQNKLVEREKE